MWYSEQNEALKSHDRLPTSANTDGKTYWNAVNVTNHTRLVTPGRNVSCFRMDVVCLEHQMTERVQNSVTWSVIHHCLNYLENVCL